MSVTEVCRKCNNEPTGDVVFWVARLEGSAVAGEEEHHRDADVERHEQHALPAVRLAVTDDESDADRGTAINLGRAIKPQTAADLTQMMMSVVQAGTGTAAQIPGVEVAGKTGTAETGVPDVYTAWFVCFAPANDPKVAVAVVLEKQLNGFGGAVAAPIAKLMLEKLLHG